jgi:L-ascorbate metabolism protein UlaG (beta-lactamase superfamily)
MRPVGRVVGIVLCVAALAGAVPAGAHPPDGAMGGRAVSGATTLAETVAARQRFFGTENVDPGTGAVRPDRVILSWFGVTNFAAALRGHVVLLDAWVPRGVHSGYVPTTPEELARLDPEAILLGHAHFDHAADAVPIAQASGAAIVGTAEHCAEMRERAPALPPPCVEALGADVPLGTTAAVELLDGVEITAVKNLHSAGTAPDGGDTGGYHVPVLPVPTTTTLDHPPTPADVAHLVQRAPDAEGGSILYRFRVGGLSFVWHDTSGPLADEAPQTFDVFKALRPVDVQLGAIQGFNQMTNGMRDPRRYIEALAPRLFVPTHHDDWLPPLTTTAGGYEAPFEAELARMPAGERPEIHYIRDPEDYVRPERLTFPLELGRPRLVRRCVRGGRLRVALAGELGLVREARFSLGRGRTKTTTSAPFAAVFGRTAVAATRSRRVRARVSLLDGTRLQLSRPLLRC